MTLVTRTAAPDISVATPRRRLLLLAAEGLLVALSSVVMGIAVASGAYDEFDPVSAVILFSGLWLYWALGALIVVRVDDHRVGRLFALAAAMLSTTFTCWSLASMIGDTPSPLLEAHWFTTAGALLFTPAIILTLPAVTLVFPTGSLPGPRWRWPVAIVVGLIVLETVGILLAAVFFSFESGSLPPTTMSTDPVAPAVEVLIGTGALAIPFAALLGVAAIVVRFRRARGEEREQLKWFVSAMIPAAILLPLGLTDVGAASPIITFASTATFPIAALAISIAITRYHLYEIDRIISRTIGWALVSGLLVTVFIIGLVGLQALLEDVTRGDAIAVAASTLIAFALIDPVRTRVQTRVDRRFNRARYDAERTLAAFAGRLREEFDLTTVADDLRATTDDAVEPMATAVWLRDSIAVRR